MDTSETYIKMCDCPEIQGARKKQAPWDTWLIGDYYWSNAPLGGCVSVYNDASSYGLALSTTWLPRQDHLQEMLSGSIIEKIGNFSNFALMGLAPCPVIALHYISMEQLWLAFVMKKKHNKVWNGLEWTSD